MADISISLNDLLAAVGGSNAEDAHPAEGVYCIVRCRNAGVWAGVVNSVKGGVATLTNARRLWYWKSAFTLSEAALQGVKGDACKFSVEMDEMYLERRDICEFLPCSKEATKSIRDVEAYHA